MNPIRLGAAILLLAGSPAHVSAAEARIADVRVGQHGDYERIVVELEADSEVAVRWVADENGADVFEIAARPLLERQRLATGRPRVGDMLLVSAESGARLSLEPRERRTRAFLLPDPPRLVIDVAAPDDAAFEAPEDVRAIVRVAAAEPVPEPEPAVSVPVVEAPASEPPPSPVPVAEPVAVPAAEPAAQAPASEQLAVVEPAAPAPAPARESWLFSRALLVPLLAGAGVLLLAAGGLALASAQRSRPRPALPGLEAALVADRLDLLEKRLDEEVRARQELAEQLAQAREELGGLRNLLSRLRAQAPARSAAPSAPQ
jgi:hypothetical protein